MDKKLKKLAARQCYICERDAYAVLDVHRIIWGGKYSEANTVVLCAICHRNVHADTPSIVIHGWRMSTRGRVLYYVENGEEKFK